MPRDLIEFDVVIVGGGPSGLAMSIRLAQLAKKQDKKLSICLIDKGETIGAHILSGAILEPRALDELLPDWQHRNPPAHTPVTEDQFIFLTKNKSVRLPTPPTMQNHRNFIISLGQFCRFLSTIAEELEVNVLPGFAATEILYENDRVCGVVTGDKGVDYQGKPKSNFQPGIELRAKQVIFAEGCRGSLTQTLFDKFQLRDGVDPQTYGLGIKEIWEIPPELHREGLAVHTIGWPLDSKTYGGSFVYHMNNNLLAIGFVVGLDYTNPYLSPYEEFQRFKTHPSISRLLVNGKRIAYGARTLVEGGLQSLPKLTFPGGLIVGDAAGFLNVPKIKGIHMAMKSGMVAAESIFTLLTQSHETECVDYPAQLKKSWLWDELYRARNIRPALRYGLIPGIIYAAIDTYLFRGHAPWTFHHAQTDRAALKKANECKKIEYPAHDNKITFDISSSLFLSHIQYVENQPYHLKIKNREVAIKTNLAEYAGPEQRYCPAGVYEFFNNEANQPRLRVNGGNCIHCKACDIKDPTKNITWTPSEGGSGPQYEMM